MIESAMPIAIQDANSANLFKMNDQGFGHDAALTDAQLQNQLTGTRMAGDYSLGNTGYQGEQSRSVQKLSNAGAAAVAKIRNAGAANAARISNEGAMARSRLAADSALSQIDARNDAALEQMGLGQTQNLEQMEKGQEYDLETIGARGEADRGTLEFSSGLRIEEMQTQADINTAFQAEQERISSGFQADQAVIDKDLRDMGIGAGDRQEAMDTIGTLNQQYSTDFSRIATHPDLAKGTKTAMLHTLRVNHQSDVNSIISMSGIDMDVFEVEAYDPDYTPPIEEPEEGWYPAGSVYDHTKFGI